MQFFASGVEHVQFSFLEDYLVRFIIKLAAECNYQSVWTIWDHHVLINMFYGLDYVSCLMFIYVQN